jgi:ArsR family transcriptional regulator, arsenate/arsenite/antimonite-responsive transcriptional repressor / arsenate reductase (thioredoxin)
VPEPRLSVLFLCTGNSARSQMAEAILRHVSNGQIDVESAGTAPQPDIHPMARRAVKALADLDMAGQYPKMLGRFLPRRFDYVITVCDRAAETCPVFLGDPERIHWSFEDPAAVGGSQEAKQRAFDLTASELLTRIRVWLSLPELRERIRAGEDER